MQREFDEVTTTTQEHTMANASLTQLKQDGAAPTARKPRTIFDHLGEPKIQKSMAAVAGKYLTGDRMLRMCVNAVRRTPLLLECDPQSVLAAMMMCAALELEPNTPQQQAWLIPYKKRVKVGNVWQDAYDCQFQIGAQGFVTLMYRSPAVKRVQAEAIHKGDLFEHQLGSDTFLKYRKALEDRGVMIGAFCYTELQGGEAATVLTLEDLHKIRSRSETYRSLAANVDRAESDVDRAKAQRKLDDTPWVMWEDEMAAKSAIKRHGKRLPLGATGLINVAAELEDLSAAGAIDVSAIQDPDALRAAIDGGEVPRAKEGAAPASPEHKEGTTLESMGAARVPEREPVREERAAQHAPAGQMSLE